MRIIGRRGKTMALPKKLPKLNFQAGGSAGGGAGGSGVGIGGGGIHAGEAITSLGRKPSRTTPSSGETSSSSSSSSMASSSYKFKNSLVHYGRKKPGAMSYKGLA